MSSILKHLPTKEETKPVQVMIPLSLRAAVETARKEDGFTLQEIVEACLKMYLEERGTKRKRREL